MVPSSGSEEKPSEPKQGTEKPPAAPKKPEGREVLEKLLTKGEAKTDRDTAFAALMRQWRIDYPVLPGMTACERAARAGLRCFKDRGNWTTLRHLNRPVILELVDGDQGRHHVVAVRMTDQKVVLDLGDQQVMLSQAAVEPFWFGDFTLLWKPPDLTSPVLKVGDKGPDVLWLRDQLDRVQGLQVSAGSQTGSKASPPSPLFDEELKQRVMEFQRTHFVEADGIVGEQTLIQLNKAMAGSSIPLLSARLPNGERHVFYP